MMNVGQALEYLDAIIAQVNMNRAQHEKANEALLVLAKAIGTSPKTTP